MSFMKGMIVLVGGDGDNDTLVFVHEVVCMCTQRIDVTLHCTFHMYPSKHTHTHSGL